MTIRLFLAAFAVALLASCCGTSPDPDDPRWMSHEEMTKKIVYTKDCRPRPPICYAWNGLGREFTTVDCAAAERLLINDCR